MVNCKNNNPKINPTSHDLLNENFSHDEISKAIDKLKNNKSPGIDGIPAEFLKTCKSSFIADLTNLFNYIIETREFPRIWTEGIRSPIYKAGSKSDCKNYRGITVLPVFEVFPVAKYNF